MAGGIATSKSELMAAIRGLSAARDLPPEVVFTALKDALASAYLKMPECRATSITVDFGDSGEPHVLGHYATVEERFIEDPLTEISLEAAEALKPGAVVGDLISIDVTPSDFGRIAAQTAKQVILQRIREAEREQTYSTYAEREGELVYGTVQNVNRDTVTVQLDRVEAVLLKSHQLPGERYNPNQRLRVFVAEVKRSPKGPQVLVSRTHRDMLRRLMELEIPEIYQNVVEIKAIAREAGSRSKVAVWSSQQGVDPVGACVGMRGVRIQTLVRELGGEKIDIVEWDADPRVFIAHALSPAKVMHVGLEEEAERRTASVIVPDAMLSLAIGREGQNARLAAKLTGWRIDIRSESEAGELMARLQAEEVQRRADEAALRDTERRAAAERAASAARLAAAERAARIDAKTDADAGDAPAPEQAAATPTTVPPVAPQPAGLPDAWIGARVETPPLEEEEEDGGKKGKKKKGRPADRGRAPAPQQRKRGRGDWDEDPGRWGDSEIEDLGITEYDFLGEDDDEEDDDDLDVGTDADATIDTDTDEHDDA